MSGSVQSRLYAALGLFALVLAGIFGSAIWVDIEHASLRAAADLRESSAFAREQARYEATLAGLMLERYVSTGNEALVPAINAYIGMTQAEFARALALEEPQNHEGSEEENAIFAAAQSDLEDFSASAAAIIGLQQAGDAEGARSSHEAAASGFGHFGQSLSALAELERAQVGILEEQADRFETFSSWLFLAFGIGAGLFALVSSVYFIRSVLEPLAALEKNAIQVAEGDLESRAETTGPAELASVGIAVNQMAESLIAALDLQREANDALEASSEWRQLAEDAAGIGIFDWDIRLDEATCSEQYFRLFGLEPGNSVFSIEGCIERIDPEDRPQVQDAISRGLATGAPWSMEFRVLWPDGSRHWIGARASFELEEDGRPTRMLGAMLDVTTRRSAESDLEFRAYHDPLTRLANRTLVEKRVTEAVAKASHSQHEVAVLFIDLDHFKRVNDMVGHSKGDMLLKQFGQELRDIVRPGDTVGRLGGDEFVIILPEISQTADAIAMAERILSIAQKSRQFSGKEFRVTASVGIACYPSDGTEAATLLANADTAMYRAKELGKDAYVCFTHAMNSGLQERLSLENGLRLGLRDEQFILHYQPQIEISTSRVVGVEALVRWQDPTRGLVMPDEFIPVAEESGIIVPLGEWVLRTACQQAAAWTKAGPRPLQMAVNVSPRQFRQPNFAQLIERVLDDTGLAGSSLILEITEGTAMQDMDSAVRVLTELKELGVQVAIDDFGTGYSSLSYLKRLPIDFVKIDSSFMSDLARSGSDASITAAIIAMSHSLGFSTIAEGVETAGQLDFLRRHGCDEAQGFLFAEALSREAVWEVLVRDEPMNGLPLAS